MLVKKKSKYIDKVKPYPDISGVVPANPSDLLRTAVMWYGVSLLPKLRACSRVQLFKMMQEASDCAEKYPIHMGSNKELPQYIIPTFSEKKRLSGAQVIALMVFGLFVLMDERQSLCTSLVETWPIREAIILSPR